MILILKRLEKRERSKQHAEEMKRKLKEGPKERFWRQLYCFPETLNRARIYTSSFHYSIESNGDMKLPLVAKVSFTWTLTRLEWVHNNKISWVCIKDLVWRWNKNIKVNVTTPSVSTDWKIFLLLSSFFLPLLLAVALCNTHVTSDLFSLINVFCSDPQESPFTLLFKITRMKCMHLWMWSVC